MRVLLDTCVLSELRHIRGNPGVRDTVEAIPSDQLFISVLTIGEIVKGISILELGRKKRALTDWLQGLEESYPNHILAVDIETCSIWGEETARARHRGITLPAVDGLIAATALRHGLALMTRNTSDFESTRVRLINPWEEV